MYRMKKLQSALLKGPLSGIVAAICEVLPDSLNLNPQLKHLLCECNNSKTLAAAVARWWRSDAVRKNSGRRYQIGFKF